jgi:hypothetical protein
MIVARAARAATLALALALALPAGAAPAPGGARGDEFRFGVIGHTFRDEPDEARLRQALRESARANPAFVVVNGIKGAAEPCADKLYARRKELLDESARPVIVSLAASDWSACRNSLGRSNAVERLNRLRELFFDDPRSLGARQIGLSRLSANAKFRGYAENAYWEHGPVLFATINLPANNNHFLLEAGRNSEFEDRLVANRVWLHRLFALAERKRLAGVVLFSDGDVGIEREPETAPLPDRRDGYASTRRQIRALAAKFGGQVLLIDAQQGEAGIAWRDNLGHLSVGAGALEIRVAPGRAGAGRCLRSRAAPPRRPRRAKPPAANRNADAARAAGRPVDQWIGWLLKWSPASGSSSPWSWPWAPCTWPCAISSSEAARTSTTVSAKRSAMPASGWLPSSTTLSSAMSVTVKIIGSSSSSPSGMPSNCMPTSSGSGRRLRGSILTSAGSYSPKASSGSTWMMLV